MKTLDKGISGKNNINDYWSKKIYLKKMIEIMNFLLQVICQL
jgi:hypothetical protein